MLRHTRRRALGLLIAACAGTGFLPSMPRALAQDEDGEEPEAPSEPECIDSKAFGPWTAQASDVKAGASLRDVVPSNPKACDLTLELQVNTDFDAKIFVEGSPDGTPLPEALLVKPESRLIAKTAGGTVAVDEALCGNCTDIYDDTVSLVLPLATAPLFREEKSMELVLRLSGNAEDCRFKIDCVTLRQALDWASERRDALAEKRDDNECTAPGCFITTACCHVLGLDDDCFELRTLRRYRDDVLAKQPGGAALIARYYALAPAILSRLRAASKTPARDLLYIYGRFVLPAALAARFGLNALAYRLYVRMLSELTGGNMAAGASTEAPRPPR